MAEGEHWKSSKGWNLLRFGDLGQQHRKRNKYHAMFHPSSSLFEARVGVFFTGVKLKESPSKL
jgi:hypothetical protein